VYSVFFLDVIPPQLSAHLNAAQFQAIRRKPGSHLGFHGLVDDLTWRESPIVTHFLDSCMWGWDGFCLFTLANGNVGLSQYSVNKGDTITVLLGTDYLIKLRSVPASNSESAWQMTSNWCVTRLTQGELIYGGRLPPHLQTVRSENCVPGTVQPDQQPYRGRWMDRALYDEETTTVRENPTEILTEIRVKVENDP
jgi:hypothetical protein